MNLLITGANGFMGRNLCQTLAARGDKLFPIDVDTPRAVLESAAHEADFVFHLAGINRPKDEAEFETGNAGFTETLLALLESGRKPPVLLSGSIQAELDNPYGRSKHHAEMAVAAYGDRTGAMVYRYRLPNAFGKWSRPHYNSAVATFCYQIARGLPVTVSDPERRLRLVYIDDIVQEFIRALDGTATPGEGGFYQVLPEHEATLRQLVETLQSFYTSRDSLNLPDTSDPLTRKLLATYLSFLPEDQFAYRPITHADARGSFTELMHMAGYGQMSVNVSKPHACKGEHWHHTKHEKFIVVSGRGIIRLRNICESEILLYPVDGEQLTVVDIPPGYTHNIENLGDTDMVTLMWASDVFDPAVPDTWRQPVQIVQEGTAQPCQN
ncbi:MAG: NAD-dependent epimerase/dehydratase family protein [Candidatus Limiplasma sp.]|nr:NAD-dependent epimerase/dehydratase family protein [Candidatus Limiplasma sp.]